MMISKKVVVIGAGAAGLMAGATAALYGASVTIIEKNKRVGRKIMITGKGRCNLANNCDVQTFINNVPVNGRFLYSAINAFTPEDTIEFFESKGLKTKTERGNRVFPVSDKSVDVVDTMHDYAVESGCKIVCDTANALIVATVLKKKDEVSDTFRRLELVWNRDGVYTNRDREIMGNIEDDDK